MKNIKFVKTDCGTFCYAFHQGKIVGIRYFTPADNRDIAAEVLFWLKEA
jgi:hypothetical protein